MRAIVERQFGRWSQARGRASRLLLLRNPDLANAIDLAKRWGDELNVPLRDFINRSARRARFLQVGIGVSAAAVFFFLTTIAASFLWLRAQRELALKVQEEQRALFKAGREREDRRMVELLAHDPCGTEQPGKAR
jgi:hypothetical protein